MDILSRLLKFEIIYPGGTAISVGVQYVFFIFLRLDPLKGNPFGSGIAFPINYYLQMGKTWGIQVTRLITGIPNSTASIFTEQKVHPVSLLHQIPLTSLAALEALP